MIYLVFGDNRYATREEIRRVTSGVESEIEIFDADQLAPEQVPELCFGATLFTSARTIVIRQASSNITLWQEFAKWLPRVDDQTTIIFDESSVDKRTKTYKWLQKNARVIEHAHWRDYEAGKAVKWLSDYAKLQGVALSQKVASLMVQRAIVLSEQGKAVIDQQLLARTTDSLKHSSDPISISMLDSVLPPSAYENVFELLAIAIAGRIDAVRDATKRLELSEDGHRVAALICSQAVNLGVLNSARKAGVPTSQVAKDIGVHPYALSQLDTIVRRLSHQKATGIVEKIVAMDNAIKTGQLDAWTAITTTLVKIAATAHRRE